MEDNFDVNKISDNEEDPAKLEFKYDFINTPWDDRSNKSKIGIVALLLAMFLAIMGCVINNFLMHYQGFSSSNTSVGETNCFRVRNEEYPYVARIYSVTYKGILCVGAVVSSTSILANGVCIKSGPVRIHLGSPTDPQCKKGLPVDSYNSIYHDGVVSKELVLIRYQDKNDCATVISIGEEYDMVSKVFILGRSAADDGKYLSRHYVSFAVKQKKMKTDTYHVNLKNIICVTDLTKCPAKVGDLLIQNTMLLGLASNSIHSSENNNYVCFADLKIIRHQLRVLDPEIKIY